MNQWEMEMDKEYIGYQSLTVLRGLLREELQNKGREAFLGNYYAKIGFYTKTWRYIEIRYLLAILEYLNPEFQYTGNVEKGKLVVADEEAYKKIAEGDGALWEQLRRGTPAAFLKYGFLTVDEIEWYRNACAESAERMTGRQV